MQHHNYYVYVVQCKDESYYTGITNDVDRRVYQHNPGIDKDCYTYERRPVELRYCQQFQEVAEAIKWEKQIKRWSRKKKQALFKEDWNRIKQLGKSSTNRTSPGNPSINSG